MTLVDPVARVCIFPRLVAPEAHLLPQSGSVVVRIGEHSLYFDDKRHARDWFIAGLASIGDIKEEA